MKVNYQDLINKSLSNHQESQHLLYKNLLPKLMGVCRRYTKSREEAQDCLQEAFIKIFAKLPDFKGDGPFEAWARRIAVNESLQYLRKNKKFSYNEDVEDYADQFDSGTNILSEMQHEDLLKLLNFLPEGKKVVFNLYVIEGYSHKEIGEMLGINENTSKSQLSRAKEMLGEMVGKLNYN